MNIKNIFKKILPSSKGRRWLYKNIKGRVPKLVVLMAMKVSGSLVSVAFALATRNVANNAINQDAQGLFKATLVLVCMIAVQIFLTSFSYHLQEELRYLIDKDLKKSVFHRILFRDYSEVSSYHSGDLLQRVNIDVTSITSAIISLCTSLVSLVSGLFAAASVLFKLSPQFALFIIPMCCLMAAIAVWCEKSLKSVQSNVNYSSGKLAGFYQESIEKLLLVQGLDVADEIEKKSDRLMHEKVEHQRNYKNAQLKIKIVSSLFDYGCSFVAMIWCAYKVLHGIFDYGTLVAITTLVAQLQEPLLSLPSMIPSFVALASSTDRVVAAIGADKNEKMAEVNVDAVRNDMKAICVDNLVFSYSAKKNVIRKTSFSVNANDMIVLTGVSGAGKSTLLKLLLGIYKPNSGTLYFEMQNGYKLPINRSTRKMFSYAPQGNLILSGTIKENILLANPDASDEDIKQALYISAMDDYINELPKGLDTMLGENGAGLSDGQVQRINIARAIVRHAPILLLDEVTSSLDMETEKIVLERIRTLTDITCIAVTHRPAVLKLADRHLHMEDGLISEITEE